MLSSAALLMVTHIVRWHCEFGAQRCRPDALQERVASQSLGTILDWSVRAGTPAGAGSSWPEADAMPAPGPSVTDSPQQSRQSAMTASKASVCGLSGHLAGPGSTPVAVLGPLGASLRRWAPTANFASEIMPLRSFATDQAHACATPTAVSVFNESPGAEPAAAAKTHKKISPFVHLTAPPDRKHCRQQSAVPDRSATFDAMLVAPDRRTQSFSGRSGAVCFKHIPGRSC
jgi:hypothetical protein